MYNINELSLRGDKMLDFEEISKRLEQMKDKISKLGESLWHF